MSRTMYKMCSHGMKKITDFEQEEDQIDGSLDRANELNSVFNRFSLETS